MVSYMLTLFEKAAEESCFKKQLCPLNESSKKKTKQPF